MISELLPAAVEALSNVVMLAGGSVRESSLYNPSNRRLDPLAATEP